jgi:hypothetical protein
MAPAIAIGFSDVLFVVLMAATLLYFIPQRLQRSLRNPPAARQASKFDAADIPSTSAVLKSD